MFSSVANYLFGSYSADQSGAENDPSNKQGDCPSKCGVEVFELTTSPADHDWELVDRIGDNVRGIVSNSDVRCTNECSCAISPENRNSKLVQCLSLNGQSESSPKLISCDPHSTNSSAPSEGGSDSEGWLITPPPCFTAGGTTEGMEVTPLENLLIEHPSMSVYHKKSHKKMACEARDSAESKPSRGSITRLKSRQNIKQVQSQPPRRPKAVAARAGILAQVQINKSSQRQKQKSSGRKNSKKATERQNKAREHKSQGKHKNCTARKVNPSGRMNNRAC